MNNCIKCKLNKNKFNKKGIYAFQNEICLKLNQKENKLVSLSKRYNSIKRMNILFANVPFLTEDVLLRDILMSAVTTSFRKFTQAIYPN